MTCNLAAVNVWREKKIVASSYATRSPSAHYFHGSHRYFNGKSFIFFSAVHSCRCQIIDSHFRCPFVSVTNNRRSCLTLGHHIGNRPIKIISVQLRTSRWQQTRQQLIHREITRRDIFSATSPWRHEQNNRPDTHTATQYTDPIGNRPIGN